MKQTLYGLKTRKGTYISMHQTGHKEVDVFDQEKPFHAELWENKEEALESKKQLEEGDEYWIFDFDKDFLPLTLSTYVFEEQINEDKSGFEIIEWNNIEELEDRLDVTVRVQWNDSIMKEFDLKEPYVVISMTKEGKVIHERVVGIDDGGYDAKCFLELDDVIKVEDYLTEQSELILMKYQNTQSNTNNQ